jgi:uncharacterized protein YdaL
MSRRRSISVARTALLLGGASLAAVVAIAPGPVSAGANRHHESTHEGHKTWGSSPDKAYGDLQKSKDAERKGATGGATTGTVTGPRTASALRVRSASLTTSAAAPTSTATTAASTALVLYDNTGGYAFLGEQNAIGLANLAGHFGTVTTEPVSAYTAGQMESFTATLYVGSTYYDNSNDAIPLAFARDVMTSTRPVIWLYDNIWRLSNDMGAAAVSTKYGWDPSTSYFDTNPISSVSYKGQTLNRAAANQGGVLPARITDPSKVTVLATAHDSTTNTDIPWAVRSGNLTYIGDQPFAYVDETDRTMAVADLLFDALAPGTAARHRALVRLEDISPASDPTEMRAAADYLYSQNVPFSFNIIPVYKDPRGVYNNGTPETVRLRDAPDVVSAIKYLLNHGGTLVMEGYTHQYSNIDDPYTGVTGDDFEFYLSHIDANDDVILDGPVPNDSTSWAQGRLDSGFKEFAAAKLAKPTIFVSPHYAGSQADYKAFAASFRARYDRTLYFNGQLTGAKPNYTHIFGQYFPYVVKDVYGQTVLPENLGDYEPIELNNHPIRLPADIVNEARQNLVVRDGFASFFYDPSNGVDPLRQIVSGIKALNAYTFVAPAAVLP